MSVRRFAVVGAGMNGAAGTRALLDDATAAGGVVRFDSAVERAAERRPRYMPRTARKRSTW